MEYFRIQMIWRRMGHTDYGRSIRAIQLRQRQHKHQTMCNIHWNTIRMNIIRIISTIGTMSQRLCWVSFAAQTYSLFSLSLDQSCFTLAFVYSSRYFVLFLSIPWALWIPQMSCTCTAHAISIQCNKCNALNSITMKIRRFGFEAFQCGISSSYTCLSWIIYIFSNWLHTIDA